MKLKSRNKLNTTSLEMVLSDTPNKVDSTIKRVFSFKGRKSPEIIEKIISNFTEENSVILDPFMGSGTTLIASQASNRHFVGIELDNYTYNVDKALFLAINLGKLTSAFNSVEKNVKDRVNSLYETKCDGIVNYIEKIYFDIDNNGNNPKDGFIKPQKNREIKNNCNVVLINKCPICHEKRKAFSQKDWDKLKQVNKLPIDKFPKDKYITNSRINITESTGANKYDRIFSHRNKVALLYIQEAIDKLSKSDEKELLEQVLVSTLKTAKISMYGSSSDNLYHVVKKGCQDTNVWTLFEKQYNNFVKFKKKYSKTQVSNFKKNEKYKTYQGDYLSILRNQLDKKKFDMIFTDFPYTDQVPYLERNQMFRIWLKHFSSPSYDLTQKMLTNEVVVTNAPSRKEKNLKNFYKDVDDMFKEFYRHINVGKNVVIFTKLGNKRYLNSFFTIIQLAEKNGFRLVAKISVEKDDPTLRKQSAFTNTPMREVIVAFEKLKEKDKCLFLKDNKGELIKYNVRVDKYVYEKITKSESYEYLLPRLLNYFKNDLINNFDTYPSQDLMEKIESIIIKDFKVTEKQTVHLRYGKIYTDIEDKRSIFIKLLDWIPILIKQLLQEKNGKFVLEDLYIKLVDQFSTSESSQISDLLSTKNNEQEIRKILFTYCDVENGYYVKKHLPVEVNKNAVDILSVDPYEFERICVDLLSQIGFLNVQEVGGAGDFGVDIVAKRATDDINKTYLIQCKRWINNVGSTPIQRLHSEKIRQGADKAICITTSKFTKDGKKIAKDDDVDLIDGTKLLVMLNNYYPDKYFNTLITKIS